MCKYASGTRLTVPVIVIYLFYFYTKHNEMVSGEEFFVALCTVQSPSPWQKKLGLDTNVLSWVDFANLRAYQVQV